MQYKRIKIPFLDSLKSKDGKDGMNYSFDEMPFGTFFAYISVRPIKNLMPFSVFLTDIIAII